MKENFNYGNAVRSARRTEHYSTCCNSPNSTCYNGMDSYHYSKKDYDDSLDTISATFIGLVNVLSPLY
jgi:hypothetical protein